MTREGQDGINSDAAGMDHSIPIVAYYIDSPRYTWTAAEIAMFPNSVHIRIAVLWTTRDGHVIDCETGDATPAETAKWAHQRRADGYAYPIVYTSVSNQNAVIAAFNAINEPLPGWWLAHYDNLDVLPAGALGKQYADPGPLDKSIWADYIPGVDGTGVFMALTDAQQQQMFDQINAVYGGLGWVSVAAPYGVTLFDSAETLKTQVAAIAGALPAEQAAILAALPTAGAPTDAQMATLQAALVAALPSYNVTIAPKS